MGIVLSRSAAALDQLFARTTGASRLGLERTAALLHSLGEPQRAFPSFHVAGTNGKGSTVATLDALLRMPARKVGRYTSPHLVDFRERILIDGIPITEDAVVAFLDEHMADVERTGATFFEATTAMAFKWFAESGVDVAVIETGLGGRLDATNVVRPLVATVTSIGIDHTEYLGTTLEDIAAEKAGIFKAGVPAVIGDGNPEIRRALREKAATAGANRILAAGDEWDVSGVRVSGSGTSFLLRLEEAELPMHTPLVGLHQAWNAGTAVVSLAAAGGPWFRSLPAATEALAHVVLPGRFQREGKFIFDVAHNPDGAATLARTLEAARVERPVVALLTVLRDKDWQGIVAALAGVVDEFVFTSAPTAPAVRAWNPHDAHGAAERAGWPAVVVDDFDDAIRLATARGATVVITGSFHTVGDAMARLRVSPFAR